MSAKQYWAATRSFAEFAARPANASPVRKGLALANTVFKSGK
jgi:hypothetical protein